MTGEDVCSQDIQAIWREVHSIWCRLYFRWVMLVTYRFKVPKLLYSPAGWHLYKAITLVCYHQ